MPRKVRQLIADLEKAGFVNRGGKGSHRNFTHPKGVRLTLEPVWKLRGALRRGILAVAKAASSEHPRSGL